MEEGPVKPAFRYRRRTRFVVRQVLVIGSTTVAAAIIMIPIIWMINAAVRPIKEILVYPPLLIPRQITFEYFGKLVFNEQYQRFFLNSVILSVSTLFASIGLGLPAAYGFSRYKIRGGRIILLAIMALLMLPTVTLIIPYFRLANALRLYDTLFGLIIVNIAFALPLVIWLLKAYVDSIPVELEEAAMIDGCSRFQALQKILMPLTVPAIVGVGTFAFITAWNEYLLAVVLTDTPRSQVITIGLSLFFGQRFRDWNAIMALATLSSVPLVIIFILFQRWVVQGMTSGAVK
jgi:multiple sugar transport system permease protein